MKKNSLYVCLFVAVKGQKKIFFENAQNFIKHRLVGVRRKLKTDNRLLFRNKFLFLVNSSIVVAS
jgi:hypothetical protein